MTKTIGRTAILFGLLGILPTGGCASTAQEPEIRNIILMIADGTGVNVWGVGESSGATLAVRSMPVVGLVSTASASHRVTDSAAGATVYAVGERVTNRSIGVGPGCPFPSDADSIAVAWPAGCEPRDSWFVTAAAKGKARGIVTTAAVVDATPASFFAHSPSRYWLENIAEQAAADSLEVIMGGGRRFFSADSRRDRRDLLAEMCSRSDCLSSAADLASYRPTDRPIVGLYSFDDMDASGPRPVGVPEMVDAALAKLSLDPDGFVAMFETEATDNDTHSNVPVERLTTDILEFDRAVARVLEFARRTPGTLVIVTSDHETGGFSLVESGADYEGKYTTTGHTAAPVALFAEGPGAERFGGFQRNDEIGRKLLEIVAGW